MWRYEAFKASQLTDLEPAYVIWVVGAMMVIAFIAFAYALYIARPQDQNLTL